MWRRKPQEWAAAIYCFTLHHCISTRTGKFHMLLFGLFADMIKIVKLEIKCRKIIVEFLFLTKTITLGVMMTEFFVLITLISILISNLTMSILLFRFLKIFKNIYDNTVAIQHTLNEIQLLKPRLTMNENEALLESFSVQTN